MNDLVKEILTKFNLETSKKIKRLSFAKLNQISEKALDELDDHLLLTSDNIESSTILKTLIKTRNTLAYKTIISSPVFKKVVKNHCKQRFHDTRIPNTETWTHKNFVQYDIPNGTCKKVLEKLLKSYIDSPMGFFMANFSTSGKLTKLDLSDTADREAFTAFLIEVASKKRKGGSPALSATIFVPGTLVNGLDGSAYEVIIDKNKRKSWKQYKDEKGDILKAPRKRSKKQRGGPPDTHAKYYPEKTIQWGLDGREYQVVKKRWICLS